MKRVKSNFVMGLFGALTLVLGGLGCVPNVSAANTTNTNNANSTNSTKSGLNSTKLGVDSENTSTFLTNKYETYCPTETSDPGIANETAAVFIQVSPPKHQFGELTPGNTYECSFIVQNIGAGDFDYTVYASPYYVEGEDYTANYNLENNYTKIADWFTFDKTEGHLDAGTSTIVHYVVTVPDDAPRSGQYAAIMVETDEGKDKNATIKTKSRIGIIVLSHVGGNTNGCARILSNSISPFIFEPPLAGSSLVENCGNVDTKASYTLKVWPLFSNETVYNNEEAPTVRDTYPETKFYNNEKWEGAPNIGVFWAEQTVKVGDQTSVVKHFVIICPLWLLFLILAIIFFIVFWLISRVRSRRKENSAHKTTTEKSEEK